MATYQIHVIIENKSGIRDPEGDTILNDLVLKNSFSTVSKIRSAKMLKFEITEKNKNLAKKKIQTLSDELRIYNPVVSKISIEAFDD